MAEKKEMHIENIKKANEILREGKIEALSKAILSFDKDVKAVKLAIEDKLKALKEAKKLQEQAILEKETKTKEPEVVVEEIKPNEVQEKVEEKKVEIAIEKAEEQPKEEKKVVKEFIPERPSFIVRREGPIVKPERTDNRTNKREGGKNEYKGPKGEYKPQGKDGFNKKSDFASKKPDFANKKPQASSFIAPPTFVAPSENTNRNFAKKKQGGDKQYEEKHTINKRALIKKKVLLSHLSERK